MTTIVVRNGWIAADSRETVEGEGGDYCRLCEKLFRIKVGNVTPAVVGLSGESSPGMLFLDWLQSGDAEIRQLLRESDADFTALVCYEDGRVVEYDAWCVPTEIKTEFHVTGSGSKAALGALWAGADAMTACTIAARLDPHTAAPIKAWQFSKAPKSTQENI